MSRRRIAIALLLLDSVMLVTVFNLTGFLRGIASPDAPILAPLLAPLGMLAVSLYLIDGYKRRTDMLSVDYASHHLIAIVAAMIGTLLFTYVLFPDGYSLQGSRAVIALSFLALAPLTLSYRRALHRGIAAVRRRRVVLFLGDRASCEAFRAECKRNRFGHRVIYSILTPEGTPPVFEFAEADSLRPYADVIASISRGTLAVEAIVLRESAHRLSPAVSQQLVQLYFAGVPTYTLELFHQLYWRKIPLYRLNHVWLFQEGFHMAREPVFNHFKRALDVVFALAGLVIASPMIAAAALAIKLDDRGPVFFRQARIGKNNTPFSLLKLRTMRNTPHDGDRYTRPDDPRITRVGRFLRNSRIDELPQLWNVLRGEMSVIGPRAEWDKLVADYERSIPCYHFRHLVRPGITGWAQVNYPYGANLDDTRCKLEYDLYYIRHFSFVLDASIVLKTIHTMLHGKGR
ncbi:MAG TPA: exopolysaccharide biosynthesis polyprenyl glycosylphosphotransferase [Opitutaceae bacterium]